MTEHPRGRPPSLLVPRALALALVSAVSLGAARSAHAEAHVEFHPLTLAQALERARAEGKHVMVDVFATWCGPCKELDEKVFTRPEVIEVAHASWIPVRFDGEKDEGIEVYRKYHVTGYPTVLFLDGNGVEIERIFGTVEPEKMVAALRDYPTGRGTLAFVEEELARAGESASIDLLYEVGYRHALRGDAPAAEKLLTRVVKLDPDNAKGMASKALYALAAWLYNPGEDWACAAKSFSRILDRFPAAAESADSLKPLAKAYLKLGKRPDVLATLDRLLAPPPGAPAPARPGRPHNVYAWFCFQNGFELARGIEVAKLGLELDPKFAGLWDTLAELYYASGKGAEAVAAIDKAIALEPGDSYFKEQRVRFSKKPPKAAKKPETKK